MRRMVLVGAVVSIATAASVALFSFFFALALALARGELLLKVFQSHFVSVACVSKRLGRVAVLTGLPSDSDSDSGKIQEAWTDITSLARLA